MATEIAVINGRLYHHDEESGIVGLIEDQASLAVGYGETALAALTEGGGSIGGTNDGDLPDLTATAAALTGTLTGTTDGALADVAAIALSTGDTYSDAAVNTAVNTAITDANLQLKELQTVLNALVADCDALRAAVRECAAAQGDIVALLEAERLAS